MGHRPRRLGAPIAAAAAVIVLVTGLAIAGAHSRGGHSSTTTTIVHKKHQQTTTTTTTHPPTTTIPATFSPASTSGNVVTYSLPFSSYTASFTAVNGSCYIQVTTATGAVPYAQVLAMGATEQLVLTGSSKIVLGAPSYVTVQVDRTPVTFPTPLPAPLDITFNAATQPGTTTTPTT